MPEPDMQLVQWIIHRLYYETVTEFIGRTCQIENMRAIELRLKQCFADVLPELGELLDSDLSWINQILSKYGVLDLTFAVNYASSNPSPPNGSELLYTLGFLMDSNEAEQFEYVASLVGDNFEDPTLLGELRADLEIHQHLLRVLLKSTGEDSMFVVEDACITNAASVWIHKYPYY